jgi:hypothetical protein
VFRKYYLLLPLVKNNGTAIEWDFVVVEVVKKGKAWTFKKVHICFEIYIKYWKIES